MRLNKPRQFITAQHFYICQKEKIARVSALVLWTGVGVLTYFAGAGACLPPAKTPEALICAANYHCTSAKEFMIDNYGNLYYFVYHFGVCKTVGRVKHPIKF